MMKRDFVTWMDVGIAALCGLVMGALLMWAVLTGEPEFIKVTTWYA